MNKKLFGNQNENTHVRSRFSKVDQDSNTTNYGGLPIIQDDSVTSDPTPNLTSDDSIP